jgi:hypothetical protein
VKRPHDKSISEARLIGTLCGSLKNKWELNRNDVIMESWIDKESTHWLICSLINLGTSVAQSARGPQMTWLRRRPDDQVNK